RRGEPLRPLRPAAAAVPVRRRRRGHRRHAPPPGDLQAAAGGGVPRPRPAAHRDPQDGHPRAGPPLRLDRPRPGEVRRQPRPVRRRAARGLTPFAGGYPMPTEPNRTSRLTTAGPGRAPNRAMLRAVGFLDEDFSRPVVGVASLYSDITPCNA